MRAKNAATHEPDFHNCALYHSHVSVSMCKLFTFRLFSARFSKKECIQKEREREREREREEKKQGTEDEKVNFLKRCGSQNMLTHKRIATEEKNRLHMYIRFVTLPLSIGMAAGLDDHGPFGKKLIISTSIPIHTRPLS